MFIARYVKKGNPDVMYHIDSGKIKPSKSLQDSLTNMLKGKPEFTLLDEQKVTYEKAFRRKSKNLSYILEILTSFHSLSEIAHR